MSEEETPRSDLALLLDLAAQLRQDQEQDELTLRRRDRTIGRALAGQRGAQLRGWLAQVQPASEPSTGRRAQQALLAMGAILSALGLTLGWGTAAALFHYDGSRPVNVVGVLSVFVGLNLLFLLFFVVLLVPPGLIRVLPGAAALQGALRVLSPASLQPLLARLLPQRHREALQRALGRGAAHDRLFGRVQRWSLGLLSQCFALAFQIGALFCALRLVVLSDLAFSWSTTLQLDEGSFHRLTHGLALPFAALFPDADPSLDLIGRTRYFRLGRGVLPSGGVDPAALGGFWPFLLGCMVFYGLVPRLLTLFLSRWRLAAAVRAALGRLPGLPALLDRLSSQLLETQSENPEAAAASAPHVARAAAVAIGAAAPVVDWAEVGLSEEALHHLLGEGLGLRPARILAAGGARSLADDEAAIAQAKAGSERGVVVLVKAWEPPLLEVLDFLRDLRRALGEGPGIVVVPVALGPSRSAAPPRPEDLRLWRDRLLGAGDPWLAVRSLKKEGAA